MNRPAGDAGEFFRVTGFPGKAGPVIGIDAQNPVADPGFAEGRAVDGQIAALGMAADQQTAVGMGINAIEVLRRRQLGRGGLADRHIEIFPPAGNRIVCAAEGYIGKTVAEPEGDRCELDLRGRVILVHIPGKANVPETIRFRCPLQHRSRIKRQFFLRDTGFLVSRIQLSQRHILNEDVIHFGIGELTEDQVVDFIEWGGMEGKVAAPVQIIQNIEHSSLRKQHITFRKKRHECRLM